MLWKIYHREALFGLNSYKALLRQLLISQDWVMDRGTSQDGLRRIKERQEEVAAPTNKRVVLTSPKPKKVKLEARVCGVLRAFGSTDRGWSRVRFVVSQSSLAIRSWHISTSLD